MPGLSLLGSRRKRGPDRPGLGPYCGGDWLLTEPRTREGRWAGVMLPSCCGGRALS